LRSSVNVTELRLACLGAAARGAAVEAFVAGAVADHQRSALEADGSVLILNIDEGSLLLRLAWAWSEAQLRQLARAA
jgi:hypothetical protein